MLLHMETSGRRTVRGEKVSAPKAGPTNTSGTPKTTPTHDEIAKRSYEIYLERGTVDGFAGNDWAHAEAELKSR